MPFSDAVLFDELPGLVLVIDGMTRKLLRVNRCGAEILGFAPEDLVGKQLRDIGVDAEGALGEHHLERAIKGETIHIERRVTTASGEQRLIDFSFRLANASPASSPTVMAVGRELDREQTSRFVDLVRLADLSDDIFVISDAQGYITYANAAARRLYGDDFVVGRHMADFPNSDPKAAKKASRQIAEGHSQFKVRSVAIGADGATIHLGIIGVYDEENGRWLLVQRNITGAIEHERELERLNVDLRRRATTDELTGVANRRALNERLELAVNQNEEFSLLLIDMDDFKSVNDIHGHTIGDEFLRIVAQRIMGASKLVDMVARLGGDEFVVFLADVCEDQAAKIAQRMVDAVGQDFRVGDHQLVRSCSIGVATFKSGESVNDVMRKADRASYRAKRAGRSRFAS